MSELSFRRYQPPDAEAVWTLHERAMAAAGTDPSDIPGTDDLQRIEEAYLASGGEFLVGIHTHAGVEGLETTDGSLLAMGGFLPTDAGYEDERTVEGDAAELHRMRVAPAYQRRGYGTGLLESLEARAAAMGIDRLLATTAERQTAAVEFYPAHGYREVERSSHGDYHLLHFEKSL
ncbi:MAG: GNAT family N-acetyltransferase [Halobacteriaceae archaeon]